MKKYIAVISIIVLEVIAVIGALPLAPYEYYGFTRYKPFWEVSEVALPAFLAIVIAGTIFYTRRESKIIRIVTPIALAGALVLTIELVKAFA